MVDRSGTLYERGAKFALGAYLDAALKQHVFDLDPFTSKRPGDEEVQADREVIAFEASQFVASKWLVISPDSEAAREVSEMGLFAGPDSHCRLLKEMWPGIRYGASQLEKKK
jgi:hypothetical protein